MQEYRNIFNQYFKKFDIKEPNILRKFHHSYRVVEHSKKIGESLNLNEHDMWLCELIGLFHDIGRFKQWTEYQTYWDKNSIDHGDLSCEILKEEKILENVDEMDRNIILTAIKNHNKYEIKDVDDERTLLFCKIIRDADKLDGLFEDVRTIPKVEPNLPKKLLGIIYEKKVCPNKDVNTNIDYLLRQIAFVFDINFEFTIKYLKEKNWFENKFNLLENYIEDKKSVEELKKFINEYVEERIEC